MGQVTWYPNWYILLVGDPGLVKKSTSIGMALSCLREVPGVHFGSDNVTWQDFVQEIDEAHDDFSISPPGTDILDQTYTQTRAITYSISEFGTFFEAKNLALVNMLTEFWDGKSQPFKKGTKTQGDNIIVQPFVNLIAGTTPRWIAMNFKEHFGGWGLSSRFVFLHAKYKSKDVPFPDELWGERMHTWQDDFIHDLALMTTMQGKMEVTQGYRELARPYYEKLGSRQTSMAKHPHANPWIKYFLARKFDHIMKLAIILSISEGESYKLEAHHWREAAFQVDCIEDEMAEIFEGKIKPQKQLLYDDVRKGIANGIVIRGGRLSLVEAARYAYEWMDGNQTKDVINQLIVSQYVVKTQDMVDGQEYLELTDIGRQVLLEPRRDVAEDLAARGEGLSFSLLSSLTPGDE